jgi:hypothetical protein
MDMVFPPPLATTFEVFAAIVSGVLYLAVGVAAFVHAAHDIRARLFVATALASAAPYSFTVLLWARGSGAAFTVPMIAAVALSLMMGSLLLFHFTQVFPWRRPWIRAHFRWLTAGYVVVPIAVAVPAWLFRGLDMAGLGGLAAVSADLAEELALLLILVVIPVVFVLGLVVPFAALLSLYKAWVTAKAARMEAARVTTFWILISQMGGGVLTILIIPLLHVAAPTGLWATIAGILLFAFGLLMPLAFAAGVWKYRVLDLEIDGSPPTS